MAEICINDSLTDDELRAILGKLEKEKDKEIFGLVCKRWLQLQNMERKKLAARAGPHMLQRMAVRFTRVVELDLSQSVSRSFYPGVTDTDLQVIAQGFKCLRILNLQNCKGWCFIDFTSFFFRKVIDFTITNLHLHFGICGFNFVFKMKAAMYIYPRLLCLFKGISC